VDVLTPQEDGTREMADDLLLTRATELGRTLFSMDADLLREAEQRQQTGEPFGGVIYAPQLGVTIGQCIDDLELIAQCSNPDEWLNRVDYLPLK
jgi:hypothetical protein